MIWNWVSNINNGETTMLEKLNEEIAHEKRMVDQQGAYYPTPEQTEMNVWQRYNGGIYWVWKAGQWETNTTFLLYNYKPKCKSINPTYVYADCVKYWSNQNQQWCK